MKKLIIMFIMCLMMGGSTSQNKHIESEERVQDIGAKKKNVIILRVKDDNGSVIMTQEILE